LKQTVKLELLSWAIPAKKISKIKHNYQLLIIKTQKLIS